MDIKTYMQALSHQEKVEFAKKAGTSLAYLSQLASGHRKAGLKTMLAIEFASNGDIKPAEMRPDVFREAAA